MKRCPECRRDYYDDSLLYCLEDGATLIQGSVPSPDEPATAILHETAQPGEAATRAQIHTTEQTAVLPSTVRPSRGFDKRLVIPLAIAIIAGAGFLGYRYFSAGSSRQIDSIAVMPFVNGSGNADLEYLSDGMTETLISGLSQLPNLTVKPRSSVFRYKGKETDLQSIGKELNVQAVLNGRVAQRGDQLTLSLELVDVQKDIVIWSEQYNRKQTDLISLQAEIARDVSSKLQSKLSGASEQTLAKTYPASPEAYQLYLQGRYFWNKRSSGDLKKATELLKAATEKDPGFALAYAGLADCYAVSYYYVGERPREMLPLAKSYAAKAIELDPTLAEPHATMGFAAFLLDWDKETAEREFLRAIELNSKYPTGHHWYSRFLRGVGRFDEAWKQINLALELEPLSLIFLNNIAEMQIDRGELDAAAQTAQKILDLDPNFWAAYNSIGIILVKQGRYNEALAQAEKSVERSNRGNASLAFLGHVLGQLGRRVDAENIIKELERRKANQAADGRDLAIVYVGLKDKDKAFEWLERSFQEHGIFMAFLNLEPVFEPLHSDPRWRDLKRRVGLPE